mmetsp:Transcript_2425/g.16331  ORF Transcript_2425/g.16331 Transcript_2425/m.16331 type:complete len:94 (-) Transcript_2425:406-687(-)
MPLLQHLSRYASLLIGHVLSIPTQVPTATTIFDHEAMNVCNFRRLCYYTNGLFVLFRTRCPLQGTLSVIFIRWIGSRAIWICIFSADVACKGY